MSAVTDDYDYLLKFVLVGESGTGKSSLMTRYAKRTFDPGFVSTIGVDFSIETVTVRGATVKLQIWDTAGQERFNTITTSYYRGSHAIVVVYDVTSRASFQAVPAWFERVRHHAPDAPNVMLVGNKSDLQARRAVPEHEGADLARDHGALFLETSALADTNVSAVFRRLCEAAVDKKRAVAAADKPQFVEPATVPVARRCDGVACCQT